MRLLTKLYQLFTKKERKQLRGLSIVIVLMGIAQTVGIASILPFMAVVSKPSLIDSNPKIHWLYTALQFQSHTNFLLTLGIVVTAVFLLSNAFSAFVVWLILKFSALQNYRFSTRIMSRYILKPYHFFLTENTSTLTRNILVESTAVAEGVVLPLMQLVANLVTFTFICSMLLFVNPLLALMIGVILGGAYGGLFYCFNIRLGKFGKERLETNGLRFKLANETFGGIKEVKVLGREKSFVDAFSIVAERFSSLAVKSQLYSQLPRFFLDSIAFGSVLIITVVMLSSGREFSQVLPVLSLYVFAGYRLMPGLQQIYLALVTVKYNHAVVDAVHKDICSVSDEEAEQILSFENQAEANAPVEKLPFQEAVNLSDICFHYPNTEQSAINHLSVSIKKNSTIAFVGETGAGKTTLVDVVLGLLRPQSGAIEIDGVCVTNANVKNWQRTLGYIPQEIFLTDASIAENIAFGVAAEDVDQEAVIAAARVANIHDFIMQQLPEQYETLVGERGVRISGGQRQRIGIARSLYHDPDVLVLDEATSALDGITESAVIEAINNLAHKKTIIMIAHRLTTVKDCDVIYLLAGGKIIDSGTYSELMRTNTQFKTMAKSYQIEGDKIEA